MIGALAGAFLRLLLRIAKQSCLARSVTITRGQCKGVFGLSLMMLGECQRETLAQRNLAGTHCVTAAASAAGLKACLQRSGKVVTSQRRQHPLWMDVGGAGRRTFATPDAGQFGHGSAVIICR